MSVNIHGKQYITVSERVEEAHKELKTISITTEILPVVDKIVVKATVITPKGTFTGISAANPTKMIEKMSPYEVAETSAVGRALGFAGYGIVDGIATADEINKIEKDPTDDWGKPTAHRCTIHNVDMKLRKNGVWDHRGLGFLNVNTGNLTRDENGKWYTCEGDKWMLSQAEVIKKAQTL